MRNGNKTKFQYKQKPTLTWRPHALTISRCVLVRPRRHEWSHRRSTNSKVHATTDAHAYAKASHLHAVFTFFRIEQQVETA